jgi:pimeloyl-ACP methyl ester carboxylesterase
VVSQVVTFDVAQKGCRHATPLRQLIDAIFDALGLDQAPVVGHSLGGMFALWHAATGAQRISGLVAIGDPANASTVASLMHAINHFRQPRPESVLGSTELAAIPTPTMFIWGSDDPYLSPQDARPSIEQIPTATLHEMPGGHGPWLVNAEHMAELIHTHLAGIVSERRRTTRGVSAETSGGERSPNAPISTQDDGSTGRKCE